MLSNGVVKLTAAKPLVVESMGLIKGEVNV
jgi:hypothetical protein